MPIVEMNLQTFKLKIPEFTMKNISAEVAKTREKATDLQAREKNAADALSAALSGEIRQVSSDNTASLFECQAGELNSQRDAALKEIDSNINAIKASIQSAAQYGATVMQETMQKALNDLIVARDKTIASFVDAANKLNEQRKDQLEKIMANK